MKKQIILVTLASLMLTPLLQACTFTMLNNSTHEEIFISDKEHLADVVSRKTLMEIHAQANKQRSKNPEQTVADAVRINKAIKKEGQIIGKWFDIYIPYYDSEKSRHTQPPAQFKKAYRVSIHYCNDDNYIKYTNLVNGFVTQTDVARVKDGNRKRYELVDFSKADQAARAHELIGSHDSDILQKNNQNFAEAKVQKPKKPKRKTSNRSKPTETVQASKQLSPQDQRFNEFVAYPGGDAQEFEGYLP